MLKKIRKCFSNKGQGTVEYALLLGFVAVILVAFGSSDGLIEPIRTALNNIKEQFTTFNEAYSSGG